MGSGGGCEKGEDQGSWKEQLNMTFLSCMKIIPDLKRALVRFIVFFFVGLGVGKRGESGL